MYIFTNDIKTRQLEKNRYIKYIYKNKSERIDYEKISILFEEKIKKMEQ